LLHAPGGTVAWMDGITVELSTAPSGPKTRDSARTVVTIAKYAGKSVVRIRVTRWWYNSSAVSRTETGSSAATLRTFTLGQSAWE